MDQNDYYTLEEVMYLFNKSKSTIIREANAGEIPYMLEPGKKKGKHYPKKAIDVLVERQRRKGPRPAPKLVFSYSTIHDLWSIAEIDRTLHGDMASVPYNTLLEWRDINREICMSLKDAGRVIAYSCLIPLDERVIFALLEDKINEKDIPLHAFQPWSTPQVAVYITGMTVQPTGNAVQDTIRGQMILKHTLQWAITVQHLYEITNWYGVGATKATQRLFESLGFVEISSRYAGERKGYTLNRSSVLSTGVLHKMLAKAEEP